MKVKYLILAVVTFFIVSPYNAQEVYLSASEYPEEINKYVNEHFPDSKIESIKKDKELSKTEYDVYLDNNVELEFNGNYSIHKIESKKPLPSSVIPTEISNYVSKNYPSNSILEWKKEKNKQKIELDNELELVFDLKGNLLGIDD